MSYDKPAIIKRDLIAGLLSPPRSDPKTDSGDTNTSDVNVKEHIRAVVWGAAESAPVPYARPSIVKRNEIKAYLDAVPRSDDNQPDGASPSDVNVKDNIVPVRW